MFFFFDKIKSNIETQKMHILGEAQTTFFQKLSQKPAYLLRMAKNDVI